MPEIILDTSPIQYLYQIAHLDLLPRLYGQARVPKAVVDELTQGRNQGISLPDLTTLSWIKPSPVSSSMLIPNSANLGAGEREVLSLALTIPNALVILDDALARSYARQLNVSLTGTLGVLLKGKQLNYIEALTPLLEELESLNFYLAPATCAAVLKLAQE